jgi:hypothetical protein
LSIYGSRVSRVRGFGRVYGLTYGSVQLRKAGLWAIGDLARVCKGVSSGATVEEESGEGEGAGDAQWDLRESLIRLGTFRSYEP